MILLTRKIVSHGRVVTDRRLQTKSRVLGNQLEGQDPTCHAKEYLAKKRILTTFLYERNEVAVTDQIQIF